MLFEKHGFVTVAVLTRRKITTSLAVEWIQLIPVNTKPVLTVASKPRRLFVTLLHLLIAKNTSLREHAAGYTTVMISKLFTFKI